MPASHSSMRSRRRPYILLLTLLALSLGLTACAANSAVDPVLAARVDGHPITLSQYQAVLRYITANNSMQGHSLDWQSPAGRSDLSATEQNAMNFLINLQLIREQLSQQGISVTAAERTDASNQINASIDQTPEGRAATTPDMRAMLIEFVAGQSALGSRVKFASAHVRIIVLSSASDAQSMLQQAQNGADFGQLSHDHSIDQSIAAQNGDLGTVYAGQFSAQAQPLEDAIFGPHANPNKFFIVQVGQQYLVVEVTHNPPATISDATQQSQILSGWLQSVVRPAAHVEQYVTTS
jgi:hypothetical protein